MERLSLARDSLLLCFIDNRNPLSVVLLGKIRSHTMNRVNTIAVTIFMIILCTGLSLKNYVNNYTLHSQTVEYLLSSTDSHNSLQDSIIELSINNGEQACHCIIIHSHALYKSLLSKFRDLHNLSTERIIMHEIGRLQYNNGRLYYYFITTPTATNSSIPTQHTEIP